MPTKTARTFSLALIVGDFVTLLAAFSIAYIIRVQLDPRPLLADVPAVDFFLTFLAIAPFWIIVFGALGLYNSLVYSRRLVEMGKLFIGSIIGILIVIGFAFVIDEPILPARLVAVYSFIAAFVLLVIERELARQIKSLLFRFGIGISRVLIIGNSDATKDMIRLMSVTTQSGYDIVAIAGPKRIVPANSRAHHYLTVEEALAELDTDAINTIIQTDLYADATRNQAVLSAAQERHINYNFIPGEAEFYSGKNTIDIFLGYPVISVHQTPLIGWGEVVKRVFDLFLMIVSLPIWGTLLLLVALLQKIFNPGPVFYKSTRLTRYSHEFKLYKFRSMGAQYGKKDAAEEFEEMGRPDLAAEYRKNRKVKNDPRITRFGRFLRVTSLDELPQFINVLKGEVSLVGPRPILPQEMENVRKGSLLHSVKSGVTGLWQVSGRSELGFDSRVDLELYYAQNWSFWLDIKILFKTVRVLFSRQGAR